MKKWFVFIYLLVFLTAAVSGGDEKKKPEKTVKITGELLQSLPYGGSAWALADLVPGILLDRVDVGGNESGRQSKIIGPGVGPDSATWKIDGVDVSEVSSKALGSSLFYPHVNTFAEVQVTTAAHDITSHTGGVQLNFVTKRGGNRLQGDFFLHVSGDAWEMRQDLTQSFIDHGWGSTGVSRLYRYGSGLGGAIIKNKMWFFGSYAVQDIHVRTITQEEDPTWLGSLYGKIDFQLGKTSGHFKYQWENKKIWNRYQLGAASQAPETAWDQTGGLDLFQAGLQQDFGNLSLNAKLTRSDFLFTLDPIANQLNGNYIVNRQPGPDWYYYRTPGKYWTGSNRYHSSGTASWNFSLDGSFSKENTLGGDHEIRFGVDYYTGDTTSQTLYPNNRLLWIYDRNDPHGYKEIWWICDRIFNVGVKRISYYLSDAVSLGRLSVYLGLRYDKEINSINETFLPGLTYKGTPIFTTWKYFSDYTIKTWDIPADFEVLSPRFSLTYDISGNGKNVLKASYARYGSRAGNGFGAFKWPVGRGEIDVEWDDKNGDLKLDWGEWREKWDWNWLIWPPWPFYEDPRVNNNRIDADYTSPKLDEVTLAFEKTLNEDFLVSLSAFYKKTSKLTWDRGCFVNMNTGEYELEDEANWYQGITICIFPGMKPIYYRYKKPNAIYRTNYGSGTYNVYKALQLVFSKKLSHGWMLDASFTLSDWTRHMDSAEFFDKTNFYYFNGGAYAQESALAGVYVNSRWQFKVSGMAQLPWGINLSGVFQAREGYIVPYYVWTSRGSGLDGKLFEPYEHSKKFGDNRLPAFWMLNLGLEKVFRVSAGAVLTLGINGYNITNNATELKVNPLIGAAQGAVLRIMNPGIFEFSVRLSY